MSFNPGPRAPPMTDAMVNLKSLLEKIPDTNALQEMIGFVAERLTAPRSPAYGRGLWREKPSQHRDDQRQLHHISGHDLAWFRKGCFSWGRTATDTRDTTLA